MSFLFCHYFIWRKATKIENYYVSRFFYSFLWLGTKEFFIFDLRLYVNKIKEGTYLIGFSKIFLKIYQIVEFNEFQMKVSKVIRNIIDKQHQCIKCENSKKIQSEKFYFIQNIRTLSDMV